MKTNQQLVSAAATVADADADSGADAFAAAAAPAAPSVKPARTTLAYRPDIDGLRALAVVGVLLYHAFPTRCASGFVGVDVFFVISGYLITTLIINDLAARRFSLSAFYARRACRLFPALSVVLACTLGVGWAVLMPGEFVQLGRHAMAGAGFASNLLLWHEAGYFDNAGATKPLLHLWSLGVEEQFYLLWPLLLWSVRKIQPPPLLPILVALFCTSMAVNVLTVHNDAVAAFFLPVTRLWELMAGALVAYALLRKRRTPIDPRRASALSVAGALMLALAFWLIGPQDPFPGWRALLPVGATCLLITAGPFAPFNRLVLAQRTVRAIGRISYPLYLWHWPLLSFGYILCGETPSATVKLMLLCAAGMLAVLTWRYVELPLRRRRSMVASSGRRQARQLAGAMVCVGLAGAAIATGTLRERIDTHGAAPILAALNDSDFPGATLVPFPFHGVVFQQAPGRAPGQTVLLGDSLMQHYGPRVEQLARGPERLPGVIFATSGGCPPIRNTLPASPLRSGLCSNATDAAYALANSAATDTVVIGAAWYGYFTPAQHDVVYDDGITRAAFPDADAHALAYATLEADIAALRRKGKRVFLLLQPPGGAAFDPRSMVTGSRLTGLHPVAPLPQFDLKDSVRRNGPIRAHLQGIAARTGAIVIDPADTLCRGGMCAVTDDAGAPLYTDPVHMRPATARRLAAYLDQTLRPPPVRLNPP